VTLRSVFLLTGLLGIALTSLSAQADYREHALAPAFIDTMVSEHGFERAEVEALLAEARRQQPILDAISRPAEKAKPWHEYRQIFIQPDRIAQGVAFWREHAEVLARAEETFDVDAAVIVAIIGVETRYGRNTGSWRVLDALATLGFDYPPRADFFRQELAHYFVLAREAALPMREVKGSYAGAMGFGQFIPSSYRAYAVDFNGDGRVDIINDIEDAIGSVANYLKVHGWRRGEVAVAQARTAAAAADPLVARGLELERSVGEFRQQGVNVPPGVDDAARAALFRFEGAEGLEYWVGFNNFYVITRYNRSPMYAMAVLQLGEAIAAQTDVQFQAVR
jgi:membrane-bound lytic murein transglycosylase B